MRKYLSLLLVTLLLVQAACVPVSAVFNDSELDWGCDHTYDNACDTDCNKCGAVREVAPHPYEGVTTDATCGAEGKTVYTCPVCGDSYTESHPATGAHTYDDDYDATCNVCGAERTIVIPGDVNDDGERNNRDLVLLLRFLNGWKVRINVDAADVDGDGKPGMKDVALLQQYLNGWDVELK